MAARDVAVGQRYTNDIIAKVHAIGDDLGLKPGALARAGGP